MSDLYRIAFRLAESAHSGQTRKNGEPYLNHPWRVARLLEGDEDKAVGLLHDVIEDTEYRGPDLIRAGIPIDIVRDVEILTRRIDETYFDFIKRIVESTNQRVMRVKMADLTDNMSDLKEGSMKNKYRFAWQWLHERLVYLEHL
jgi:(p)ppGpp synthase/HD superfamily hydrolase